MSNYQFLNLDANWVSWNQTIFLFCFRLLVSFFFLSFASMMKSSLEVFEIFDNLAKVKDYFTHSIRDMIFFHPCKIDIFSDLVAITNLDTNGKLWNDREINVRRLEEDKICITFIRNLADIMLKICRADSLLRTNFYCLPPCILDRLKNIHFN